jgi:hypothetical protein
MSAHALAAVVVREVVYEAAQLAISMLSWLLMALDYD